MLMDIRLLLSIKSWKKKSARCYSLTFFQHLINFHQPCISHFLQVFFSRHNYSYIIFNLFTFFHEMRIWVPRTLTFKNDNTKYKTFLVKMSFICMTIKILFISMASHLAMFVLCRIVFAPARKPYPGFANFIDKWSQCDFCFTNFGVFLEYLESSITTKKAIFRPSSTWSWHVYTIVTERYTK